MHGLTVKSRNGIPQSTCSRPIRQYQRSVSICLALNKFPAVAVVTQPAPVKAVPLCDYAGGTGERVAPRRRYALVDHDRLPGGNGKFFPLHQRRCFPDPFAAGPPRDSPDRSRPAGVDAQLGHGDHAGSVGLRAGPRRRAHRSHDRISTHRGRRLCRGVGPFDAVDRYVFVPRRHGGGQLQHGRRAAGVRLVPAAPARSGNGHPPDRTTAGNRAGRADRPRTLRTWTTPGADVPRADVRDGGVGQHHRDHRSAPQIPQNSHPRRNWPVRTADRPRSGGYTRWPA